MALIEVEGLGTVEIQGTTPTPEEEQAIIKAINQDPDIPITGPGGKITQRPLTEAEQAESQARQIVRDALKDPSLLEQIFPDSGRAATIAATSLAGASQGLRVPTPVGKLLGTIGGGTLGAVQGSLINDLARGTEFDESIFNAVEEGKLDLLFSAGVPAAFQSLRVLGPEVGKVLGVGTEQARQLADFANQRGFSLGITDATKFSPVSGIKRVLGVFPFISGPFRKAGIGSREAINTQLNDTLNRIAPSMSLQDAGVDAIRAAKNASQDFKRIAGDLYTAADETASRLVNDSGQVIPIVRTRAIVGDATSVLDDFTKPLPKGVKRVEGDEEVTTLVRSLAGLGNEKITVQELRGVQSQIQELMGKSPSNADFARLARLKQSTEKAVADLDFSEVNPEAAQEVVNGFRRANEFFAKGMQVFDNPTARKATRIDKNIFKAGPERPGSLEPDEFLRAAINLKSPRSIASLKRLLGPKQFKQSFRAFLDEQIETVKSVDENQNIAIDFDRLARNIGLDGVKRSRRALQTAFEGSGVEFQAFENLMDTARQLGPVPIPSSFVARRATLGGFQAALRAVTGVGIVGGAAFTDNIIKTVVGVLVLRQGAKALSSPEVLRLMTRVTEESATDVQKKTAATRLLRLAFDPEPPADDQ